MRTRFSDTAAGLGTVGRGAIGADVDVDGEGTGGGVSYLIPKILARNLSRSLLRVSSEHGYDESGRGVLGVDGIDCSGCSIQLLSITILGITRVFSVGRARGKLCTGSTGRNALLWSGIGGVNSLN